MESAVNVLTQYSRAPTWLSEGLKSLNAERLSEESPQTHRFPIVDRGISRAVMEYEGSPRFLGLQTSLS